MELPCLNIEKTTGGAYLRVLIRTQMLDLQNLRCLLDTRLEILNKQLEIVSLDFIEVGTNF